MRRDNTKIKIGFCAAYDWELLRQSIPLIYEEADLICISIDQNRRTWAGQKFEFDEAGFREFLGKVDPSHKIKIYEDDFSKAELSPMANEVRQRNMLALFMGINDGWHLQLDTDEYFLNFSSFVKYLKKIKTNRPINVCCPWIVLYKRIPEGFLIVDNGKFSNMEFTPIATNKPDYQYGRRNGHFNLITGEFILHQSWARSESEIYQKLQNWGHKNDSDTTTYFDLWKSANINNYEKIKDFNMMIPTTWRQLVFVPVNETGNVMEVLKKNIRLIPKVNDIYLKTSNSLFISRLRKVLSLK